MNFITHMTHVTIITHSLVVFTTMEKFIISMVLLITGERDCTPNHRRLWPNGVVICFKFFSVACRDESDFYDCTQWASRGECYNNEQWMRENCQYSCNKCHETAAQDQVVNDGGQQQEGLCKNI